MEEATASDYLYDQDKTIACTVLYLEILHWFFKFDGICKINAELKFWLRNIPSSNALSIEVWSMKNKNSRSFSKSQDSADSKLQKSHVCLEACDLARESWKSKTSKFQKPKVCVAEGVEVAKITQARSTRRKLGDFEARQFQGFGILKSTKVLQTRKSKNV